MAGGPVRQPYVWVDSIPQSWICESTHRLLNLFFSDLNLCEGTRQKRLGFVLEGPLYTPWWPRTVRTLSASTSGRRRSSGPSRYKNDDILRHLLKTRGPHKSTTPHYANSCSFSKVSESCLFTLIRAMLCALFHLHSSAKSLRKN